MMTRFRILLGAAMLAASFPAFAVTSSSLQLSRTQATAPAKRPVVALLTDFGLDTEAVGLCHGVILNIDSNIAVVDLSHNAQAYDILLGALMLRGTTVFPKGTVFVGVVDPGVGTRRQPVAIRTKQGLYYVAPDNGLLTYVIRDQGVDQAVVLDEKRINPKWEPGTFDGRDLFSPAGALLASSGGDLSRIGRPAKAEDLILLETPEVRLNEADQSLSAVYLRTDEPYGNVWTNITGDDLTSAGIKLGDQVTLEADGVKVTAPLVVSFGHVPEGQPLAYIASHGTLAFALNQGNFSQAHGMKPGMKVTVRKAKGD